ncbi:hypothetical protein [Actinopolymorpha pittospori]|uniref:Uncharacterized protein n=1 Tax=Actinopolymorpha pittospori TaxID=648752 RepID=A0A927MUG6_9ACTN|nr:hypothetical protein [Actinopolymorpha pittospori]MBE1603522.1 hypothetical protein [Actinopolymorpha pittospori]
MTGWIKDYVRTCLAAFDAREKHDDEFLDNLQAGGHRIVVIRQETELRPDGNGGEIIAWQIRDFLTEEILAAGRGTDSLFKGHHWQDNWYDYERAVLDAAQEPGAPSLDAPPPSTILDLPASLADALTERIYEWVSEHQDEAREWVR